MTKRALQILIIMIVAGRVAAAQSASGDKGSGTIVVAVVGIEAHRGGSLIIALHRGKEGWLDVGKALLKKIEKADSDSITVTFENVSYDSSYAVQVIHDTNGNGKLDFRKFPYPRPKEGAGVSNNIFRMGPPDYEKARIALAGPLLSTRIGMRY